MRSVTNPPSIQGVVSRLRNGRLYDKVREIYVQVGGELWNVHECIGEPITHHIFTITELFNEFATDGTFERPLFEYPDSFDYPDGQVAVHETQEAFDKVSRRFG
jgi:hypothetical protein